MITSVLHLTCLTCAISFIAPVSSRVISKRAAFYIANETMCIVDGEIFRNGDPVPTDDHCERCTCRPPGFSCVLRDCDVKPGCKAVRRDGECCPEYVCGCVHSGKIYEDGEIIKDIQNPCYTCRCHGSSISCVFADCMFRGDCVPEYVSGECCPRYDHCPSLSTTPSPTVFTTSPSTVPPLTHTETVKHTLVTLTTLHLEKFTEGNTTITIEDIQPSPSTVTKFTTRAPTDEKVTVKFIMTSATDAATSETSVRFPTTASWLSWFATDHSTTPSPQSPTIEDHDAVQTTKENAMFIIVDDDTGTSNDYTEINVTEKSVIWDTTTSKYISESTTHLSTSETITTLIIESQNQTEITQQSSTSNIDQLYPKETITTQDTSQTENDSLISLPSESESSETSSQQNTTEVGRITLSTDASVVLDDTSTTAFDETTDKLFTTLTPPTERIITEPVLPDTSFDEKVQNEQLLTEKTTTNIEGSSPSYSTPSDGSTISTVYYYESSTAENAQTTSSEKVTTDGTQSTNFNEKTRLRYTTIMEEQNTSEHLVTQQKKTSPEPKTEEPNVQSTQFNKQENYQTTTMANEKTKASDFPMMQDESKASIEDEFGNFSQNFPENHDIPAASEYTENSAVVSSLKIGDKKESYETTSEIFHQTKFPIMSREPEIIANITSTLQDVNTESFRSTEKVETHIFDTESSTTASTISYISLDENIRFSDLSTGNTPEISSSTKSELLTANVLEVSDTSALPELGDSGTKTAINMHQRISSSQGTESTYFSPPSKDSDVTIFMITQKLQPMTLEDTITLPSSDSAETKTATADGVIKTTTVNNLKSHFSTQQLSSITLNEQQHSKSAETSPAPRPSTQVLKFSTEDPNQNNEATLSTMASTYNTNNDATLFAEETMVDIFKSTRATEDDTFEKTKSQSYTFTKDTTPSASTTEKEIATSIAIHAMAESETAASENADSDSTTNSKIFELHTADSDINNSKFDNTVHSSISEKNDDEPCLTTTENSFATEITSDSTTMQSGTIGSSSSTDKETTSTYADSELSTITPSSEITEEVSSMESEIGTRLFTLSGQNETENNTTTKQTSINEVKFSEMGNLNLTFFTTIAGNHLVTDTTLSNQSDFTAIQDLKSTENKINEYKTNTDETTFDMLKEKIIPSVTQETSRDSFPTHHEEFVSSTINDDKTLTSSEKGETTTPLTSFPTTTEKTRFNSSLNLNKMKPAYHEITETAIDAEKTNKPLIVLSVTNLAEKILHETTEYSSTESFNTLEMDTEISLSLSDNHQPDTHKNYSSSPLNDHLINKDTSNNIIIQNVTTPETREPDAISTAIPNIINKEYDATTSGDIDKISEVTSIPSTHSDISDDKSTYNSKSENKITINTENSIANKHFTTPYADQPERKVTSLSETTIFEKVLADQDQNASTNFVSVENETVTEGQFFNDITTISNDMVNDTLQTTDINRYFETDSSTATTHKPFDETSPVILNTIKTTTEKQYEKTKHSDLGDELPTTFVVTESVFNSLDQIAGISNNNDSTTIVEHSITSIFSNFTRHDEKILTDEIYKDENLSSTSTVFETKTDETLSEELFPDETSEKTSTDQLITKKYKSTTITTDDGTILHSSSTTDIIEQPLNGRSTPEIDISENMQHKTTSAVLQQNFTSNLKMNSAFVNEDYYSTDYDITNKTNDELLDSINLDLLGESIIMELMKGNKTINGNTDSETPKPNEILSTVHAEFFSSEPRETSETTVSTTKNNEDYSHFPEDELDAIIRKEIENINKEMKEDEIETNETLNLQELPGIWYGIRTELPFDSATNSTNIVPQNMSDTLEKLDLLVTVTESRDFTETQNSRSSADNDKITLDTQSQLQYRTLSTFATPNVTEKEGMEMELSQGTNPATPFPESFVNISTEIPTNNSSVPINIADDLSDTEKKLGINKENLTTETKEKGPLTAFKDTTNSPTTPTVPISIKMEISTEPQKATTEFENNSEVYEQNKKATSEFPLKDSEMFDNDELKNTKDKEPQAGPEKGGEWFEPTLRTIHKNGTETKSTSDGTELQTIQRTELSSQPTTTTVAKPVTYENIENGPEKGGEWFEPDLPLVLAYNKNISETTKSVETSILDVITDVNQKEAVRTELIFESTHDEDLENTTTNTITENHSHSGIPEVLFLETKTTEIQPPLPILLKVKSNGSIETTTKNIEFSEEKLSEYNEYASKNSTEETSSESMEYNAATSEISKPAKIKLDNHESLKSVTTSENLSSRLSQIYHILLAKNPASDIEVSFKNSTVNKSDNSPVKTNDFLKIPDDIPLVEGFKIKSGDFFAVTSSLIIVAPSEDEETNKAHVNDSGSSPVNKTAIIENITVQNNRTNVKGSEMFSESHQNSSKRPESVFSAKPLPNSTTTNTVESNNAFTEMER